MPLPVWYELGSGAPRLVSFWDLPLFFDFEISENWDENEKNGTTHAAADYKTQATR